MRILPKVLLICLSATLSHPAHAKVIRWNCTYPVVANPNGVTRDQDFSMLFALDNVTGKATLTANNGVVDVAAIPGDRAITFLKRLSSGAIQATTVDVHGNSVHSRHILVGESLVPSQSYGTCTNDLIGTAQ
jgi:hypothetical protein